MRHSETLGAIAPALVKALSEIGGVEKAANNPFFKSKYATLENVIDASKPILARHGLSVMQFPGPFVSGALSLETVILHESGEWLSGDEAFGIAAGKQDPQAVGSALTYARRYAQMAVLNIPAVDDDGEGAMNRQKAAEPKRDMGPGEVEGVDWWKCEGPGMSASQAKKEGLDDTHEQMRSAIDQLTTAAEWKAWCADNTPVIATMPRAWRTILRAEAEEGGRFLGAIND
jgi:hypothetical protein